MRLAFELQTARGIGDAVCGLYAAVGIAQAGHAVILSTHHHPWLAHCTDRVGIGDFGSTGIDCSFRYDEQLITQRHADYWSSRAQFYLLNIALKRGAGFEGIQPAMPTFNLPLQPPPVEGPYMVLNPFSAHTARIWGANKWRELAQNLVLEGITPIAIGASREARELQRMFHKMTGAHHFWNQSPDWVRSTMKQSIGFVGNDSGMTHVAASLGVPTVVVMSHIRPHFVYAPARVTAVVPDEKLFPCRFCGWQTQFRYRHGAPCLPFCSALQSISVSTVLEAVKQTCLHQLESIAA